VPSSVIFVTIGGVTASGMETASALDILRTWRTTTVQVPLRKVRNPLGWCDYHAAAEPFRSRVVIPMMGKGANGRPLTKVAFCLALESAVEQIDSVLPYAGLLEKATRAFMSDPAYSVVMARSAVAVMAARHRAALRSRLVAASQQAVAMCASRALPGACGVAQSCGTGACPFADKSLAFLRTPSQRGRTQRPARHIGDSYDPAAALSELEEAEPFEVAARTAA
jgi:hypothetical protein